MGFLLDQRVELSTISRDLIVDKHDHILGFAFEERRLCTFLERKGEIIRLSLGQVTIPTREEDRFNGSRNSDTMGGIDDNGVVNVWNVEEFSIENHVCGAGKGGMLQKGIPMLGKQVGNSVTDRFIGLSLDNVEKAGD